MLLGALVVLGCSSNMMGALPAVGRFMQNKPVTLGTLIVDDDWTDLSGWTKLDEIPPGAINAVSDASAPDSPPGVLEFKYLNSSYSGTGAGSMNLDFPSTDELYLSFVWYASPGFTWADYSNKLLYVGNPAGAGGNWIIELAHMPNYSGDFFIMANNGGGASPGGGTNMGYPWGLGDGGTNPTHNGATPRKDIHAGHWYEIELRLKKGAVGSSLLQLWSRDITAGEAPFKLIDTNQIDMTDHTWDHFQVQSILGGGFTDISATVGQYYHIDQLTAYRP
jgi:hypothetical protein